MKKAKFYIQALAVIGAIALTAVFVFVSPSGGETDLMSTQLVTANNVTSGLVGYWPFDEGSGSTAYDSSGYGYNGDIHGATWTTGKFGNGLSFDGMNDSVTTELDVDQSESTSGATFAAWVNPTGIPSTNNMTRAQIVSTDNIGYDWSLLMEDDDWTIFTGGDYENDVQLSLNQWTHVAATFNPSTELASLYVNGELVDSADLAYDDSASPIAIGDNPSGSFNEYFQGTIDEVYVYNRALSSSEVESVYQSLADSGDDDTDTDTDDNEDDDDNVGDNSLNPCDDSWADGTQWFTDVDANSSYFAPAMFAGYFGIFDGYSDGSFKPFNTINRAEVAKVILGGFAYNIEDNDGSNGGFWDLDVDAWYMPYVYTAYINGILTGNQDGSMRPGDPVNRVELLKVFLESAKIDPPACTSAPYADVAADAWYCEYAKFAKDYDLLSVSSDEYFQPSESMTRGDVAELFYNYNEAWCLGYNESLEDEDDDEEDEEDSSDSYSGGTVYLSSDNTVSVVADEYHVSAGKDDWSIKSGEWLNTSETYASLLKTDIPSLETAGTGYLTLKLAEFNNKLSEPDWCSIDKTFYVKKLTSSWDPDAVDYWDIQALQDSGEIIGTFTLGPDNYKGEYISVELSLADLVGGYGWTIDQADEALCRASFYSPYSEGSEPYLTAQ